MELAVDKDLENATLTVTASFAYPIEKVWALYADPRKLEVSIEKALVKAFEYDAKVVIKSKLEMMAIIDRMPKDWRRPSAAMRYYVLFLRHAVDSKKIL